MSRPADEIESGWKNYIFPDFKALNEIHLEKLKDLIYEEVDIDGFEIYLVEQWAEERKVSSLITSYTGNTQDIVRAVRICLPSNQHYWPQIFKEYLEDLKTFSQAKVINNDTLFITNLSSFPSTLNLLNVECGDLRKVWDNFRTNFNLKKLDCAGRSSLLLKGTTNASLNKFAQLYKIQLQNTKVERNVGSSTDDESELISDNDNNKFHSNSKFCPVTELVSLVQITLNYFSPMSCVKTTDGLLCNNTRRGIDRWWIEYGKFYLGIERPKNEVIMGPTTVASLFSLLLTCYFKFMVEGSMSAKDPFDEEEFYTGIYLFQKKYNINKLNDHTYLDRLTLQKLFDVSVKSSSSDIFNLTKVVKSTVQDFAGKGNFMHLSNEILTSDLSILVKNIHGGTLGALWKDKDYTTNSRIRRRNSSFINKTFHHGDPIERLKERYRLEQLNAVDDETQYAHEFGEHTEDVAGNLSSESSSVSSMINNYENLDQKQNIETNLNYQREYYRRNSIPFAQDGIKMPTQNFCLKRRNSVSQVANTVERWQLPFDLSVVRAARDIIYIQTMLLNYNKSQTNEYDITFQIKEGNDSNPDLKIFKDTLKKMEGICEQYDKGKKNLESRKKELEFKQNHLKKELEEINILTSRFQYNIRILNARINEVETNINRFDNKLKDVEHIIEKRQYPISCELDPDNDKEEFDKYIELLNNLRKDKYKGITWKMISTKLVQTGNEAIKAWYRWIFQS